MCQGVIAFGFRLVGCQRNMGLLRVCEGFGMASRDMDGYGRVGGSRKRVSSGL